MSSAEQKPWFPWALWLTVTVIVGYIAGIGILAIGELKFRVHEASKATLGS